MLSNPWIALVATFIVALIWLRLNDFAAHRGWIGGHLSRKIIHIGTGPIFVACWVLFPDAPISPYLASLVPFAITIQFFLVGIGVMRDQSAVQAMTRTGDRREILRGPLYYGIVFVLLTIFYWLNTPIGIVALMILCGGDGLADILGRKYGKKRVPWNQGKSWIGSLGMFIGGWILAMAMVSYFVALGIFSGPVTNYLLAISAISLISTIVETLPLKDLDNISITLTAVILGHVLF